VFVALANDSCHISTLKFESAMHADPRDCSHVRLHAFATIINFGRVHAAADRLRSCHGLMRPYVVAELCCENMNVLLVLSILSYADSQLRERERDYNALASQQV